MTFITSIFIIKRTTLHSGLDMFSSSLAMPEHLTQNNFSVVSVHRPKHSFWLVRQIVQFHFIHTQTPTAGSVKITLFSQAKIGTHEYPYIDESYFNRTLFASKYLCNS